MNLSILQTVGLLISILGIAGLAIWSGTRPQSYGNINGSPIVAGIIMGTLVGGSSTVGTAQLAFNYGMSAWWFTLGGGIACMMLALVYAKPWRRSGCMTLIGIISKEYGPRAGLAASLMSSLGTFINVIAQLIAGTAVIAVIAPNLGMIPALIITAAFMALYVVLGGTQGAGIVGILKLVLLYVSMIGCGAMVLVLTGGIGGFLQMTGSIDNPAGVNFGSLIAQGAGKDIGAGVSLVLGVLTTQTYAQAVMSGKSDRAARTGSLISAFLIPPIGIGGILVGLFMRANHPDIIAKNALTTFTTLYLPPVLSGLILGTLFIAVVGTGAGLAMGISTIIRRDILQRYSDRMSDAKLNNFLSKCIIILVMAAGVLLSSGPLGDTILSFGFMSMGLRGAVVFFPMTLALWKHGKINKACILVSIIASPLTVLLFGTVWHLPGGLDPLFAGVAVSAVCCIVGRMIGNRKKTIRLLHPSHAEAEHLVIVIDSELGSHSSEIAHQVAGSMGIPCYDKEILTKAAEISGISEKLFKRYDERPVIAAYDITADETENMKLPPSGAFVQAQMAACRAFALQGPCVLTDRFASRALSENSDCIKVFIGADFEYRAKVYALENGLGAAAGRKKLHKLDRVRTRYYKGYNKRWGYAGDYAFVVNSTEEDPKALAEDLTERVLNSLGGTSRKQAAAS